jgi:hypothetical protein
MLPRTPECTNGSDLLAHRRISMAVAYASRASGFLIERKGRSVDRRRDSMALPRKSFEPIGRHARIVRATLQESPARPARGHPRETSRYRGPGLCLHLARGTGSPIRRQAGTEVGHNGCSGTLLADLFRRNRHFQNCLIFCKSSLFRHDESLIARKNSLFKNVGNLPLSP